MIRWILEFSIRQRVSIVLLWMGVLVYGLYCLVHLPVDAVPDVTNRQVQINVLAPTLGPDDVERRITFPLEVQLAGLPYSEKVRSISQFGLSQITVVFEDKVDIYLARQWVSERLQAAKDQLPPDIKVEMAPVSTGLGEVLYVRLHNPRLSLMERRALMDWEVRPQLRSVKGLADVNVWGGEVRQIQVKVDPRRLQEHGLSFAGVAQALRSNNANGGGSFIRDGKEQRVVTSLGLLESADDLKNIGVGQRDHVPVFLSELGDIQEGAMLRQGAITQDGQDEEVYGIALLLLGENGRSVVDRIKARLPQIEATLPAGTRLEAFLDRTRLINATLATASKNLMEGGLLVIGLLFAFLLQLRAGLIVSCAIPFAMLVAIIGMYHFRISANLMSLGAIDFGIIVDGSVIIVENCVRRLSEERERLGRLLNDEERRAVIADAASEVRGATQFGEILIISTYLPILTLQGIEGKMFAPMGWTVILALTGAMLLSFTLIPSLCSLFLASQEEHEHPLMTFLTPRYQRFLEGSFAWGWKPVLVGLLLVGLSGAVLTRLGSEFIPELSEGSIAMQINYPTSISLDEAIHQSKRIEGLIRRSFPQQVERIVTRIGRPEIATDPMLTSQTDVLIDLKPGTDQRQLVAQIERLMQNGQRVEVSFTQPIKMRMMELIEGIGVRADLGIKLYGAEMAVLAREADAIAAIVGQVPGSADVMVERTAGQPQLRIRIRREAIARLGIHINDVNQIVEAALGGAAVTSINNGNRRIDIVLRLPDEVRNSPELLARLQVPAPDGELIALSELADFEMVEAPVQIGRENGRRRIVVQSNVRGRDLGSFVEEVQRRVARHKLPVGYYLEYGGTYEKMQSGRARLAWVVPLTFLAVFLLLYWTLHDLRLAVLVFTGIPFAVAGGVLALWMRSMPVSISAAIGFLALGGVAVLNGVVLVTFIEGLVAEGKSLTQAALQGAVLRLRPVLMTAAVASLGFVPMAISSGSGAEVQRPLATVVIGGLFSSTALTLWLLPCLYLKLRRQPNG